MDQVVQVFLFQHLSSACLSLVLEEFPRAVHPKDFMRQSSFFLSGFHPGRNRAAIQVEFSGKG
jgi:hypothetical protein